MTAYTLDMIYCHKKDLLLILYTRYLIDSIIYIYFFYFFLNQSFLNFPALVIS